ncbi:28021_t:CDS:2 [Dentiscutata erythropus]|uniref:28021_t:CDS:1 n=1 Tax=Dentiscutata erythropus TaxID=1348616 RepID=A0A9N9AU65_9GLOM|nr:28021_t:CDS:2 [Dentiscutata erythropus]
MLEHAWTWTEQNKGSFGQQKCTTLPSVTNFLNKFLQAKSSLENLEARIEELKEAQETANHDEWTEKIVRTETTKKNLDTNMQTLLEQKFVDNLKLRLSKINRHKVYFKHFYSIN